MKLLIIGGTRFVGRAITQAALDAGHQVTLFNRGKSNPGLFDSAETLIGDRDGDLTPLQNRRWDAVIDTSGYLPRHVRKTAQVLKENVDHYTFISTISTYTDFSVVGIDEQSPQQTIDAEAGGTLSVDDTNYGALKTMCERALDAEMDGQLLHVRPALIVGPHDPQDLFPYWVHRVAQGGEVLVPGTPQAPMQVIDARDLAKWVIAATEQKLRGAYITTGPNYTMTMREIVESCKRVSGSDATFTYVGDAFLLDQGLTPNSETPWWIPEAYIGYGTFDNHKAVAAGLTFRPIADTIRDTLAWLQARSADYQWQSGISAETEQKLLHLWHNR